MRGTAEGAVCVKCPFAKNGMPSRPVFGSGPENPKYIVLGEGPGYQETQQLAPFVGPTGKILNVAFVSAHENREEAWVTNSFLCFHQGATDAQKDRAAECCLPRLKREIGRMVRLPILALGRIAAKSLIGDWEEPEEEEGLNVGEEEKPKELKITQIAGTYHEIDGHPVIPSIHPATMLHGGAGKNGDKSGAHGIDLLIWTTIYDLSKVARMGRGDLVKFSIDTSWTTWDPEAPNHVNAARNHKLVQDFFDEADGQLLSLDTETVGPEGHSALETYFAEIRAIGFATEKRAISIAKSRVTTFTWDYIRDMVASRPFVFHNACYDRPVLYRNKMGVGGSFDDTMLLHHAAFPGLSHDLQRVASQFFCIPPWKAEFRAGEKDIDELLPYNALDALATIRLYPLLLECAKGAKTMGAYKMDIRKAAIACKMSIRGVPVDKEENARLSEHFLKHVEETEKGIFARVHVPETWQRYLKYLAKEFATRKRRADPPDYLSRYGLRLKELADLDVKGKWEFLPTSREHFAAYLQACGVQLFAITKTGRKQTSAPILEPLRGNKIVKEVLTHEENRQLYSNFAKKIPGFLCERGRVHPVWSVNKITGRMGAERPVIMNVPKDIVEEVADEPLAKPSEKPITQA